MQKSYFILPFVAMSFNNMSKMAIENIVGKVEKAGY